MSVKVGDWVKFHTQRIGFGVVRKLSPAVRAVLVWTGDEHTQIYLTDIIESRPPQEKQHERSDNDTGTS